MTPSPEQIRAVAQAITDDLMRQDGTFDGPFLLPEDMELSFIEQNCVDMGAVARAAIAAMPASGRKVVLAEVMLEVPTTSAKPGESDWARGFYDCQMQWAAAIRAMAEKEPTP